MDNPNFQFQTETEYKDGDKGTGAWAIKPGPAEIPEIPGDDFASENFEGVLWQQITFFGGDWVTTNAEAHEGTTSFTNKDIDDGETSSFFIFNDVGATELRFWLKTDSETGFDKFTLLVDFVEVFEESGPTDWQFVEVPLNAAFETIEFRYEKDSSGSPFTDAVYVDELVLGTLTVPGVPARPFVYTPLKMTDDGECLKVHICDLDINGALPVTSRPLDCEFDSVTICPPVSGLEVIVTNFPDPSNLDCSTDSVEVCQGTDPWVVSGTVSVNEPVTVDGTVAVSNFPVSVEVSNDVGNPLPVTYPTGTLSNGAQTAVAAAAVQVLAANTNRKAALIQNVGLANVRVGVSGVATTTGFRLVPGQIVILEMPFVPTQAVFAIREGAISSTVLAMEIV